MPTNQARIRMEKVTLSNCHNSSQILVGKLPSKSSRPRFHREKVHEQQNGYVSGRVLVITIWKIIGNDHSSIDLWTIELWTIEVLGSEYG